VSSPARRALPAIAALVACGGAPAARPTPRRPLPVIDLVPLEGFSGPARSWRLHPDGRIENMSLDEAGKPTGSWRPGPILAADGTIRFPRPTFPQEVTARVTAKGDILVCDGQPAWGRIDGDRLTVSGIAGWVFRIDASGHVIVNGSQRPPDRVAGAVDARSRRTALVVYTAFFLGLSAASVGEGGTTWCP